MTPDEHARAAEKKAALAHRLSCIAHDGLREGIRGGMRHDIGLLLMAAVDEHIREATAELEQQLAECRGITEGRNAGPEDRCTDCGRMMVWSSRTSNVPSWMCPECVYDRMNALTRSAYEMLEMHQGDNEKLIEMEQQLRDLQERLIEEKDAGRKCLDAWDEKRHDLNCQLLTLQQQHRDLVGAICEMAPNSQHPMRLHAVSILDFVQGQASQASEKYHAWAKAVLPRLEAALAATGPQQPATDLRGLLVKLNLASDGVGFWIHNLLDDPKVCEEMKASIGRWLEVQAEVDDALNATWSPSTTAAAEVPAMVFDHCDDEDNDCTGCAGDGKGECGAVMRPATAAAEVPIARQYAERMLNKPGALDAIAAGLQEEGEPWPAESPQVPTPGQVAYQAYYPESESEWWHKEDEEVQAAWEAAAQAVLNMLVVNVGSHLEPPPEQPATRWRKWSG